MKNRQNAAVPHRKTVAWRRSAGTGFALGGKVMIGSMRSELSRSSK
jgi:hypothetical protein